MTTRKRLVSLLLSLVALAAAFVATSGPALAVGACPINTICFYDTPVSATFYDNREVADADRNVPYQVAPAADYIVNTSMYVWIVSTSTNCVNTRGTIYAHSAGQMNATYANKIRCYFRTSTTGKVAYPSAYLPIAFKGEPSGAQTAYAVAR